MRVSTFADQAPRLLATLIFFSVSGASGAATVVIGFDVPPSPLPSDQVGISSYQEHSFLVKPLGPIATETPFRLRINGGDAEDFPRNGTPFLQLALGDTFEMTSLIAGVYFDVTSVDLAEYSTNFDSPMDVGFFGYREDGGIVSAVFTLDGVIGTGNPATPDFETFEFPTTFTGLVRLETTSAPFSMDNLSIVPIPEPGVLGLLCIGALLVCRRGPARQRTP